MTIIRQDPQKLGGQEYPFLMQFKDWTIQSRKIGDKRTFREILNDRMTIFRWGKDGQVNDLYIPSINSTEEFLSQTGLEVSLSKGAFVLWKRFSRIMRPYFVYAFLDSPNIVHDGQLDKKIWDGAALVSRKFLLSMVDKLPSNLDSKKRKYLVRELSTCGRVELTVLSKDGQDKGHAIVLEDMSEDIIFPQDTKRELRLSTGQTFVGVQFVHSADSMWLDVQSLIFLHPFFNLDNLIPWLKDIGTLYLDSIRTGEMDTLYERMSENVEDITNWYVLEYIASGGKAMWFASIIKSLAGQFKTMVQRRGLDKVRLPIPGGRYYVMVDKVAGKEVPQGHIELDKAHATAWISSHDWNTLSARWGGADQDDALWIFPFIDYDGEKKVLAWRSPNQLGEYAVLKPHGEIAWAEYPTMDSRLLPPVKEAQEREYLDLIKPAQPITGKYSIKKMTAAIKTMRRGLGVLGSYVNWLMIEQLMDGDISRELPAELEDVIDSTVKLGNDLSGVMAWLRTKAMDRAMTNPYIPRSFKRRWEGLLTQDSRHLLRETTGHWTDRLVGEVQAYLHEFDAQVEELAKAAMPPVPVIEYGIKHVTEAAGLKAIYANIMTNAISTKGIPDEQDIQNARVASQNYLKRYPVQQWTRILAGALVRTYLPDREEDRRSSDAVCWQIGEKVDGIRKPGIAQVTLKMLRECGVIGEVVETKAGRVIYHMDTQPLHSPVKINGTWFAYAIYDAIQQGKPKPTKMGDVPREIRDTYKQRVKRAAEQGFYTGKKYLVVEDGDRKYLVSGENIFGFIQRGHENRVSDELTVNIAVSYDGNLVIA